MTYFIVSTILTYFLIKLFIIIAKKKGLIDNQNPNYSHKPTPTGAGIVFLIIFLLGNLYFYFYDEGYLISLPNRYYIFLSSIFILTLICFIDDMKSIDPILRLIFQVILIYLSITALDLKTLNLPIKVTFLFVVLVWIYLMNIINFVDGSDGFLTINMFFYWIVILLITNIYFIEIFSKYLAIILIPIILVFFYFNKPIASVYMGDAGSIFFGFLTGFSFLELLISGYWNIALGLLIFPILDCTICLIKKLFKGHMPWVGMYDYYFLIPVLRDRANHKNILIITFIFHILNSLFIYLQLYFDNSLYLALNIISALSLIIIFKKIKIENFKFFN